VAKSSANILFNRSAKNDYLICADEKTSINDKHGQASGGTRQSWFATYDTHVCPAVVCPAVDISGPAGLDNHRHPVTTSHRPGGEHGHALIHNRMGDTRRETRCDGSQILKPQEDMNMKVHRWKTITALAAAASLALAIGAAPSQAATPVSTKVTRP